VRIVVRLVLWTWFLAAVVVGKFELLARLPAWGGAGILLALTALVLAACLGITAVRDWFGGLDLRAFVLLHTVRFAGFFILLLISRGVLPYVLAAPAGWGEITVAFLALVMVLLPLREEIRRHALLIWNTIGLMNFLFVGATVTRIGSSQPWQLHPLQQLPQSVLPTFLGPLLLATHVIIYVRLRRSPETATPG
jgi:hypothetical protein